MKALFDCSKIQAGKIVLFLDDNRTVTGESLNKALANAQEARQHIEKPLDDTKDTSKLSVTNICFCGNVIPGKRIDRRYCSPRCRQQANRAARQLTKVTA